MERRNDGMTERPCTEHYDLAVLSIDRSSMIYLSIQIGFMPRLSNSLCLRNRKSTGVLALLSIQKLIFARNGTDVATFGNTAVSGIGHMEWWSCSGDQQMA